MSSHLKMRIRGSSAVHMSMVFKKSCQSGEAPGDWKEENIVPILKKNRKEDLGTAALIVSPLGLGRSWKSCP